MKTGIFIPTYNASKDFIYFKSNLAILKQLPKNYQVLFIDSSSKDNTVEIIKQSGFTNEQIKIIPQHEFDHGRTRQLAAEILADCEVVVYLTQDAELTSVESIYNIINEFDNPKVGTAFGRQLPHKNADIFAIENRAFNYPSDSYTRSYEDRNKYGIKCVFSSDSFAAYRISALKEIGGFPSHCIVSEDMYVATKMLKVGYKISYVAKATCYHSHNYTFTQEFQRYFDIGVFFADESWIKDDFGTADSEGKKSIIQLAKKVLSKKPWLFPEMCLRILIKIVSFKLGANYLKLPISLVEKISAQKQYW
ncbi:MAG: glycosyltransferase family 2 protein [Burkholderiales bacterium]|nr:glycosyltransferase family 2 protein [Burkholderiales bacterium]